MTTDRPMTGVSYKGEWYDTLQTEDIEYLQEEAHAELKKSPDGPPSTARPYPGRARVVVDADVLVSLCGETLGMRMVNRLLSPGGALGGPIKEEEKDDRQADAPAS